MTNQLNAIYNITLPPASEIISTIDRQQPPSGHHSPRTGTATATTTVEEVSSTTSAVMADGVPSDDDSDASDNDTDSESHALQRSVVDGGGGEPHHHHHHHGDVDSFDHVLQTTSHHEAVYAYYYMDENHKVHTLQQIVLWQTIVETNTRTHAQVKVTEIFDMTDNEDPNLQTINERAINQQLQFDASEWDALPSSSSSGRDAHCHVCLTLDWESSSSRCVRPPFHLIIPHYTSFCM